MRARAEGLEVLVGNLRRDRLGWSDHVCIGNTTVQYWIWDALQRMPEGKKVRIRIEVLEDADL